MSKLHSYGINVELINWIRSFLGDRSQHVKINNVLSSNQPVLSGIPHGSVLGPLLFIIYINDLPEVCSAMCHTFLFADDAKLYKCVRNQHDAVILNQGFEKMTEWCKKWLMKLNVNKCKVLSLCSNKNNIVKYRYAINLHV